jgi:transcription antitermination factor NusG
MNTVIDDSSGWFVLQTLPRSEKKAAYLLGQKGYECFLPTYRQKRHWSDRVVIVDLPLFSSYLFCRFNSLVLGRALDTPGVSRIVAFGGRPAEVPEDEIESLKLLTKSDLLRTPWSFLPDGTVVRVESGPLTGATGIICVSDRKHCLVISVTMLLRSVAVQLDDNTVVSVIKNPNSGPQKHRKNKAESYSNSVVVQLLNSARV